jgi:putative endonuclease
VKHFVYIIQSLKDNKYYIGYTTDVQRRLAYHNLGINVSTKPRRPFKLVYYEEFSDKKSAQKRERQIKSYKGGEAFKGLLKSFQK